MMIRTCWLALMLAVTGFLPLAPALAQTATPVIRSLSVDQVGQLTPGTELIFRATGTPGGSLQLQIDGVANQLGLVETSAGSYQGAYTISIRDRVLYDSKVKATLRLGARQTTALLAQTLLTDTEHARVMAALQPNPQISRFETRNTGAFSGGHELSFVVIGSPGGSAQVSLDGGITQIALAEDSSGRYTGNYTVKTRDYLTDTTQVLASLAIADKTTRVVKNLAAGSVVPTALIPAPVVAACIDCGVVQAINAVKVKGKTNFLGAIAGGVAGAALGNQVGKGTGKAAATVLGAVGGAVAGREIEKNVRSGIDYEVVVRMDDGSSRTVGFENDPGFKVGSKVRLSGESLLAVD